MKFCNREKRSFSHAPKIPQKFFEFLGHQKTYGFLKAMIFEGFPYYPIFFKLALNHIRINKYCSQLLILINYNR